MPVLFYVSCLVNKSVKLKIIEISLFILGMDVINAYIYWQCNIYIPNWDLTNTHMHANTLQQPLAFHGSTEWIENNY